MRRVILLFLVTLGAWPATAAQREVAITFDDLPATHSGADTMNYVTDRLLATIRENRIPAIGFVTEAKLYEGERLDPKRVDLLRQWLDAGLELGNHTFSHIAIDRASLAEYQEDVIRGEKVTSALLAERGKKLRYFRHTQLRTGPTPAYKQELDRFLAARGYTVAPVTIDNNEYIFADVYSRARSRGDDATMKRVAGAYLIYMKDIFTFFEQLSKDFLGYELKQTLLLHANELNADYFDELVVMMKQRGYRFISLEQALRDPAYGQLEAQSTKGLSWLHRWMLAKGQKMRPEPLEPESIRRLFRTYPRGTSRRATLSQPRRGWPRA